VDLGVAFHAASFGMGLFMMLARRQRRQGVGEVILLLFLGHPAPRSQSL